MIIDSLYGGLRSLAAFAAVVLLAASVSLAPSPALAVGGGDAEAAFAVDSRDVSSANVSEHYRATAAYLSSAVPVPAVSSIGGEWALIGIARAGYQVPEAFYQGYFVNLAQKLMREDGILGRYNYTEYSRAVLALTAAGYDPTDVVGYDLLAPLADFDQVCWQGINGPMWALIALDSGGYDIPDAPEGKMRTTREGLITAIASAQLSDGGWTLWGSSADIDLTAMGVQALAPYYESDARAKDAVDRALARLSVVADSDWQTLNAEAVSQIIVALAAMDVSVDDARFARDGKTMLDALMAFAVDGGGFSHLYGGSRNGMACEQGYYALVAYFRAQEGKPFLYDMSDAPVRANLDASQIPPIDGGDFETGTDDGASDSLVDQVDSQKQQDLQAATKSVSASTASAKKAERLSAEKVSDMIEALLYPSDAADLLPEDLSMLNADQIASVFSTWEAYGALSAEDKELVGARAEFADLIDRIGAANHHDERSGLTVEGLPWYVKVSVSQVGFDAVAPIVEERFAEKGKLLELWDIGFIDSTTGEAYESDVAASAFLPAPGLEGFASAIVLRVDASGESAFLEARELDDMLVFDLYKPARYGIVGYAGTWEELKGSVSMLRSDGEQLTSGGLSWPSIALCTVALAAFVGLAIVRVVMFQKGRRKDGNR